MQLSHQEPGSAPIGAERTLLTALEVQELLHIDRSTVYRMADDGRLPSIRVGRTRRFPADQIRALASGASAAPSAGGDVGAGFGPGSVTPLHPGDGLQSLGVPPHAPAAGQQSVVEVPMRAVAQATIDVAADLLGVMMVVTDMVGNPLTEVANPCPWFAANSAVEGVLANCIAEWRELAADPDLTPHFARGAVGFECARTFIRSGNTLVGMVLAGGISPTSESDRDPDLYHLSPTERDHVLIALPKIAAAISTQVPQGAGPQNKEN